MDLSAAPLLVVGGGAVALQKLKGLPKVSGSIRIVAPTFLPAVLQWAKKRGAEIRRRALQAGDVKGRRLVFCCASDSAANARAAGLARQTGAWVCQAGDPSQGNLQVPAKLQVAGLSLTLSTGGASPALAKALRRRLEAQLRASDLPFVLARLKALRPQLKAEPKAKARLTKVLRRPGSLELFLAPRSAAGRARINKLLLV